MTADLPGRDVLTKRPAPSPPNPTSSGPNSPTWITPTGRFIETIGWYDPKQEGNNFSLNLDRADYWLSNGAQPSDTAASLLKKARALPVQQAVSGEVTEEEVPVAAVEAEEAAEVVAEEATEEKA